MKLCQMNAYYVHLYYQHYSLILSWVSSLGESPFSAVIEYQTRLADMLERRANQRDHRRARCYQRHVTERWTLMPGCYVWLTVKKRPSSDFHQGSRLGGNPGERLAGSRLYCYSGWLLRIETKQEMNWWHKLTNIYR